MTNILNSRISTNTNPIPARKLSSSKDKAFCITEPPKPLYKYSMVDALNREEQYQLQLKNEAQNTIRKKEKKDYTFLRILSLVTLATIFLTKKINKTLKLP